MSLAKSLALLAVLPATVFGSTTYYLGNFAGEGESGGPNNPFQQGYSGCIGSTVNTIDCSNENPLGVVCGPGLINVLCQGGFKGSDGSELSIGALHCKSNHREEATLTSATEGCDTNGDNGLVNAALMSNGQQVGTCKL